jgi:2-dehydro-3-deoxyglucarate aldolase
MASAGSGADVNRLEAIRKVRAKLRADQTSVGSWMQIPSASVAEIMGQAGYDWIAVDLEHGAIGVQQLPDLFRAIELGGTLPLVRVARGDVTDCKHALDAGAGGIIVPMVESAAQLEAVRAACQWPPAGTRGVGFSRANLFGKHFEAYREEAQAPLLVAMIEHERAVAGLEGILAVRGLDAILIGPYDLSASMGLTAQFEEPRFVATLARIRAGAAKARIPCGVHVVAPSRAMVDQRSAEGFRFIAHGIDAQFLLHGAAWGQPENAR